MLEMRAYHLTSRSLIVMVSFFVFVGRTYGEEGAEPSFLQKIVVEVIMQLAKQIGITTWDVAKATWCENADFRDSGVQRVVRITHKDPAMIERVGNRAAGCGMPRASIESTGRSTASPVPVITSRQPRADSGAASPQQSSQQQSRPAQNSPQDFRQLSAAMLAAVYAGDTKNVEQLLAELDARPRPMRPLDRTQAQALNSKGHEMLRVGDLRHAVESFAAAVNADPGYEEALTNLGYALIQQGRYSDAQEPLLDSLAVAPKAANAYLLLGEVLGERPKPWAEGATGAFMLAYVFSRSPGVALQSILKTADDGQLHDITRASAREAARRIAAGSVPIPGK
jgi:hypothetical protein